MDKGIHVTSFFSGDVVLDVEAFDLTSELASKSGWIELGNGIDAGLASNQIGPRFLHRVTHGGNEA